MLNFKEDLNKITTFIFDIDGVFTNNTVLVLENGEVVRNVNGKDGYAIQLALKKNYRIVVISGGNNLAVKTLLSRTGIKDIFINVHDKLNCYLEYAKNNNLKNEEVVYMGDDLPDFYTMRTVGLAVCPYDAAPEIKDICKYISPRNGGEGCVRDIIEQVMKVQGKWEISNW